MTTTTPSGAEAVTLRWVCKEALGFRKRGGHATAKVCNTPFTLSHLRSFYEAGACTARCPSCGATLVQREDSPEKVTT